MKLSEAKPPWGFTTLWLIQQCYEVKLLRPGREYPGKKYKSRRYAEVSSDIVLLHINVSSNGYLSSGAATTMKKIVPKDNQNNHITKNKSIKINTNKHAENKTKKQRSSSTCPFCWSLLVFFPRNLLLFRSPGHLSLQQLLPKVDQTFP